MSESKAKPAPPRAAMPVETSQQRRLKYGANMALTIILVVAVAAILIWGADKYNARADVTGSGVNSLRPQTINIIKDLKTPIKLVSLYPRLKQENVGKEQDFYTPVVNVLEEYRRNSPQIEVQVIDPAAEPEQLNAWLDELKKKYGGNVEAYNAYLEKVPKAADEVKKLFDGEIAKLKELVKAVPRNELQESGVADMINGVQTTLLFSSTPIVRASEGIKTELARKLPDYTRLTGAVSEAFGGFGQNCADVKTALEQFRDAKAAIPQAARDYAKEAVGRFEQMKKVADDLLAADPKKLDDLKLEKVRKKLVPDANPAAGTDAEATPPAIAVMGPNDLEVVSFNDVWTSGNSTRTAPSADNEPARLRFAGEQRITSAILTLTQPKKLKIAFVRDGGLPLIEGGAEVASFYGMSDIADRLRSYNCEVLEKDFSGQAAMMAAQQQQPPPKETSEEEIKDAVWVVVSTPPMTRFDMMRAQSGQGGKVLPGKLKEHLDRGGSAMVLFVALPVRSRAGGMDIMQGDDLAAALAEWGVERQQGERTDSDGKKTRVPLVAVHETIRGGDSGGDFIEQARRQFFIFVLNEYGEHPITHSLQSLDLALLGAVPVGQTATVPAGATVTPLLPLPTAPVSWGEADLTKETAPGKTPTFDQGSGDVPTPLYVGAAVEKKDKGRLVVLGSQSVASNEILGVEDPKIDASSNHKIHVARFPGNGELFTNSVFWLAREDGMIGLSPSALDTSRIQVSPAALNFWRWGVLMTGLPALAIVAGLFVWNSRRD